MTGYKVGDRLRGTASGSFLPNDEAYEGVFRGDYDCSRWPRVFGDDGNNWLLDPDYPIDVVTPEPTRELIGKAPEVKGPMLVGPFKADGREIKDVKGDFVGYADAIYVGYEPGDDNKIAEVIAKALNAYFGIEV